ncbi:MAG: ABC transporter substrate-binding protein [Oscillospiraceae bacterium]|nr:ABC transporter substrate-binding protein [Oscillospiraceae bacterium]
MTNRILKRALSYMAAVALLLSAYGAIADGPINMTVSKSLAQTLDMLPANARERTDTIIFGVTSLYGNLNPLFAETQGDTYAAGLMYDEWVFLDEYGKWGDGMTSVSVSPDGLTYAFSLKPARYSDAALVSAEDCVNTLYLVTMPGFDGNRDLSMLSIQGLDEYIDGTADVVSGFQVLSNTSFSVTLTRPNASAAALFTLPALRVAHYGSMIRPDGMGAVPDASQSFYQERLAEVKAADASLAAYGQYDLESFEAGKHARFIANADYWRAKPSTEHIELTVVPVGEEYDAMLNGDIDIAFCYPSFDQIDRMFADGKGFVSMYEYEGDTFGYVGMDMDGPPFSDARVRQAFAHGLRRWSVEAETLERFGSLPGMILFDSFGTASDVLGELYPYNSDKSIELLDAAGWVSGEDGRRAKDGQPFELTFTAAQENPIADSFIQELQYYCSYAGITLTVERVPLITLIERVEAGECDMYLMARKLPTSAAAAAGLFGGPSPLNVSGYDSDGLERFFMWAALEPTPERQSMVYEGLFQQLYLELPMIPLYRRNDYLLVSARVRNTYISTGHDLIAEAYRMIVITQLESE